jgi:hypothetical protein
MNELVRARIKVGSIIIALVLSGAVSLTLFLFHHENNITLASPTDVEISTNTTWTADTEISGTLTIRSGATLTINCITPAAQIVITADNVNVEAGAVISSNGKGSAGGVQANGSGTGGGAGSSLQADKGGGGGGYGGAGGNGDSLAGGATTYGSNTAPTDLGSGGGGNYNASLSGGAGGGAIKFVVSGTVTVSGSITAEGADGTSSDGYGGGGGSGGSIWFDVGTLAGAGAISVNGGDGTGTSPNNGGGGGGGRMAIYYDSKPFTGTTTAAGGTGANAGGAGSIYQERTLSSTITHASLLAGATSNTTVAITTGDDIPVDGDIKVTFPDGFDISGAAYVSGNTGSTVSVLNQVLTINLGTAVSAEGTESVVVSGIKNPLFIGSTGAYTITTYDDSDAQLDTATASANTLTAPALTISTPSASGITVTVGQSYDITWSSGGEITNSLSLFYSTDSGSTYPNTIAAGETNDGTYSWTVPDDASATVKVKIQDTFSQAITDTSTTNFDLGTASNIEVSSADDAVKLAAAASDSGLVGWWHFNSEDGGQTTEDSSSSSNTGTISSAAWSSSGKLGSTAYNALSFDGSDDYVSVADSASVSMTEDITISAWVKLSSLTGCQAILSKDDVTLSQRGYALLWNHASYANKLIFSVSSTGASFTGGILNSSFSPTAGEWFQVAAILDAESSMKIYVNGDDTTGSYEVGSLPSAIFDNNRALLIGCNENNATGQNYLNGLIDEVRLYNRAISAAEVSTLYKSGTGTENLSKYKAYGTLISRVIDTGGNNEFGTLTWSATTTSCGDDALKIQLAGSDDNSTWTTYTGSAGTETGLLSLWHMDAQDALSSISDSSGNDNTGTISGATWSSSGQIGSTTYSALQFDGTNDYVDGGTAAGLGVSSNLTVTAWVNPDSISNERGIVSRRVSGSTPINYHLGLESDTFKFYAAGGQTASNAVGYAGSWVHVVGVFNDSTNERILYLNGLEKVKSTGVTGTPDTTGTQTLTIGNEAGLSLYFDGLIDEVVVYNRALSASEILARYHDGSNGLEIDASCFTSSGVSIPSSLNTKRYIKYKACLQTSDVDYTPLVNSITINFTDDTEASRVISDESDNVFTINNPTIIEAGSLSEPATVSSLATTFATKVDVFDFKITDGDLDGLATNITRIIINQSGDEIVWTNYIAGASLTDGTTPVTGTVNTTNITFGDGENPLYTIANGTNKTFVLSIYLQVTLPAAGDNTVLGFSIDADTDITMGAASSEFFTTDALTTALSVDINATGFIVTGTAAMTAGDSNTITIKAIDANENVDANFTDGKTIVFSGANIALDGTTNPTCSSSAPADVAFGSNTTVTFSAGSATSTMKLYKAETAVIKATDGTLNTATAKALTVTVSGGAASKLAWGTAPHTVIVANAPWKEFTVNVTDDYENVASGSANVTIAPTGGSVGSGCTQTVATSSSVATFNDFTVTCASYPGTVTVEGSAAGLTSTDASSEVTVAEKYTVAVNVTDFITGANLHGVTIDILSGGVSVSGYPAAGNSPFTGISLLYGEYTLNLIKTSYVEITQTRTADVFSDATDDTYDNSISWDVTMTSLTEATADYDVKTGFIYDQDDDMLISRVWLERRGILITNDIFNKLGPAVLEIYGSANLLVATATMDAPDADDTTTGVYYEELLDVTDAEGDYQLTGGQSYYVKCIVNYGGLSGLGRQYESGEIVHINVSTLVRDLTVNIQSEVTGAKSDIISSSAAVRSEVLTKAQEMTAKVSEEAADVKTAHTAAVAAAVTSMTTETDNILTASGDVSDDITSTEEALTTKISDAKTDFQTQISTEVTPGLKAGILTRKQSLKRGDSLTISYRTTTGLSPTIDVYSPANVALISTGIMVEVGTSGVYEYTVTFSSSWGTGDFSVVCSETTKGTADATAITVLDQDIEDIGRTASAIMGSTSRLSSLSGITASISALNSQISLIESSLSSVTKAMSKQVGDVTGSVANLEGVFSQLISLSNQVQDFGATKDLSLEKVYEVSKDKKEDMLYLKNKAEELKAVMELSKKMIDNVANKPVTQVWFEFRE